MSLFGYDPEQLKRDRKVAWKLTHVCYNCGLTSKKALAAASPTKAGNICEECRKKLWEEEEL